MKTTTRHQVTAVEAAKIVSDIRELLYCPNHPGNPGAILDPENEWEVDTIEYVAGVLHDAELVPDEAEPLRPVTLAPLHDAAPDMLAALQALYEHCAMVHNRWGEGCNQREADAAIAAGKAAIAKATAA